MTNIVKLNKKLVVVERQCPKCGWIYSQKAVSIANGNFKCNCGEAYFSEFTPIYGVL